MRQGSIFASVLVVLIALAATIGSVGAQSGTPAGAASLPIRPDPSECTTPVPSIDEVLARIGVTPIPGTPDMGGTEATPATPAAFALPTGKPADAATVSAITDTLRQSVACDNTGNFLSFLAFVTDDYVRRLAERQPLTEADVAGMRGTPPALPPSQYASLLAVREARVLSDGRVGVLVESNFPADNGEATEVDFFIFRQVDGRWLIDEEVDHVEGQYPPTIQATPAA